MSRAFGHKLSTLRKNAAAARKAASRRKFAIKKKQIGKAASNKQAEVITFFVSNSWEEVKRVLDGKNDISD